MSDEGQLVADRYRLTEPIGSGAMGVVWQAYDERLHRTIALKQLLLQPGLSRADTDEARARAMREGRIAARLQHPNAVAVYDVAEHDGQPVLVMEYVPSRSLAAVLEAHGPLPPREVARIGAQVATALVAAHSAGIVHRDIKPGNVLLADDGNVKITDFGISRAVGDVTVTATGMLAGTPAYLAPEVAKGEPPGSPSDVFSLGSTLYAAVEGQPPFGLGENTLALLHAVAACRTRPAQQAGPLTALLGQMLRPSPAERPTMQDVANTLAAIAAGQHAPLTPATVPASAAPIPVPIAGPTNALAGPGRPGPTPTRLDAHPAGPSGGTSIGSPMLGPPSRPTPAADRPGVARPWRKWLLTALAIVLAALLGILVASFFTQPNTSNAANSTPPPNPITSSSAPVAPVATTTAAPTTTTTTTTTTTPTTTAPPAKPTFAQLDALAREYYGLLPGNPAGAWQLLTAKAQQQSGGFTNYQNQISKIFAIQVWTTQPHGGNGVVVTLSVETTSAQATLDRTVVTFTQQNGQLLIDGISKASKVGNGGPGGG